LSNKNQPSSVFFSAAVAFYHTATFQGIALHNRRLKVGWGKHSGPPSPGIAMVVQAGGSRNVYIGQIDDMETFDEVNSFFAN
jgi:hypothetical protein